MGGICRFLRHADKIIDLNKSLVSVKRFARLWRVVDFIVPLLHFGPVAQHRVHPQSAFWGRRGEQGDILLFLFIHQRKTTSLKPFAFQHQPNFLTVSFSRGRTFLVFYNDRVPGFSAFLLSPVTGFGFSFSYTHSDKRMGMQIGLLFILSTSGFRLNLMMLS